jgi:16S rRNA processing protein RimM
VHKPQGRHGEVAVELFTSFPESFAERRQVWALDPSGCRRELRIDEFWSHKGRMILKFAGIDDIAGAELLAGSEIQVPRSSRVALPEGDVYISDVIGCRVFNVETGHAPSLQEIGIVSDVTFGAGEAPLLVIRSGERTLEIPFAAEYIARQDLAGKRLELKLPEGMLDLDAPLSAEEKQRQHEKN